MWSKAERFLKGLHVVGDILTKKGVNCVLNYMLHYYLCVYFYGFFPCVLHMYFFIIVLYEYVHWKNVFVYFKLYI
jgi:mannose/fructose/N-acetylgalactosamine-specific phosphotransferase system component IIC